ncbi:hypothetical protein ACPA54_02780 [Uniformispora flossi]|uniref:hypothetical protein n=1 Tax=Uniformispora flossi TaxID=3390723 RepID=UPI003C2C1EBB
MIELDGGDVGGLRAAFSRAGPEHETVVRMPERGVFALESALPPLEGLLTLEGGEVRREVLGPDRRPVDRARYGLLSVRRGRLRLRGVSLGGGAADLGSAVRVGPGCLLEAEKVMVIGCGGWRPERPRGGAVFVARGASAVLRGGLFAYCDGAVWAAGALDAAGTHFKECSVPSVDDSPAQCDIYIADGAPTPRLASCRFGQYVVGVDFPTTSGLVLADVEFGAGGDAFRARGTDPELVGAINARGRVEAGAEFRPAFTGTFPPTP